MSQGMHEISEQGLRGHDGRSYHVRTWCGAEYVNGKKQSARAVRRFKTLTKTINEFQVLGSFFRSTKENVRSTAHQDPAPTLPSLGNAAATSNRARYRTPILSDPRAREMAKVPNPRARVGL